MNTLFEHYKHYGLQEPIRLPTPTARFNAMCLGFVGFGFAGLWMITEGGFWVQFGGVLAILLFIAGLITIPPLLRPGDMAVIDLEGFYTKRYNMKIVWTDIVSVGVIETNGYENLCVAVKDYEKYRNQIPWTAAWLRSFYKGLLTRFGSIVVIAVIDPISSIDGWNSIQSARHFDFIWTHHEFPMISITEIQQIIETESKNYHILQVS